MSLFTKYVSTKLTKNFNKNKIPLDLHPGTRIRISDVPVILAETSGSLVKNIIREAVIEKIGYYTMNDLTVFRSYFNDGKAFIEVPVNEHDEIIKPLHIRVYALLNEDFINNADFKEFLLTGHEPLVGWFQFGLDDNTIVYDRSWVTGPYSSNYEPPVSVVEHIINHSKEEITENYHYLMLYQRQLENITEFLYADYYTIQNGTEIFSTYVGIDVTLQEIGIFPN